MIEENVVELGQHGASVESVISRLVRHQSSIKSITAVIQWDDNTADVVYSPKKTSEMAYDALLVHKTALEMTET